MMLKGEAMDSAVKPLFYAVSRHPTNAPFLSRTHRYKLLSEVRRASINPLCIDSAPFSNPRAWPDNRKRLSDAPIALGRGPSTAARVAHRHAGCAESPNSH